jgi:hypothetical protein
MINVGESVPFWVTADWLRPALADLLAGQPLKVAFASRTTETPYYYQPTGSGDVFYLGLEGSPRSIHSSLWGDLGTLTGMFIIADSGSSRPIVGLAPLSDTWSAIDRAHELGFDDHEIIAFEPPGRG